jgi:hypothetical protein
MRSLLLSPLLALGFAACGTDLDSPGLQPGEMGFGPASVQNYGAPLAESELFGNWLFCADESAPLTPPTRGLASLNAGCTSLSSGIRFAPDHKLYAINSSRAIPSGTNAVDVGSAPQGLTSGLGGLGGLGGAGGLSGQGSLFCRLIGTYTYSRGSILVSSEGRLSVATISQRQGKVRFTVPSSANSSGSLSSQNLVAVKTDLECQSNNVGLDITPPPQTGGGATNGPAGP